MNNITISKVLVSDVGEILDLCKTIPEFDVSKSGLFWTKEQLTKWCESSSDVLLIAKSEEKIIGFGLFACHVPLGKVTFENLYVDPMYRGKGIATNLFEKALVLLKEMKMNFIVSYVKFDNNDAKALFKKNLFNEGEQVIWMDRLI